jgi:transcriptional regulator GlxA family with amidase domain
LGGLSVKNGWEIGILLFNEVEVLAFAGPFEVFSVAKDGAGRERPFVVSTVSETGTLVHARNGLKIQPDYSFDDAPPFDIILIPGGYGAREIEINNSRLIRWITERMFDVEIMASVCTGAFLLAKAGLLDGKSATTHWLRMERFAREFPKVDVMQNVKFVDQGKIVTSAGISAGINMSFHILKRLLGQDAAERTAREMEYDVVIE